MVQSSLNGFLNPHSPCSAASLYLFLICEEDSFLLHLHSVYTFENKTTHPAEQHTCKNILFLKRARRLWHRTPWRGFRCTWVDVKECGHCWGWQFSPGARAHTLLALAKSTEVGSKGDSRKQRDAHLSFQTQRTSVLGNIMDSFQCLYWLLGAGSISQLL